MLPDTANLLLEIGTEELPPKALQNLMTSFARLMAEGLKENQLSHARIQAYATPRRLALQIYDLASEQPDQTVEKKGPAVKAAIDQEGNPTKAAAGFMRSVGVSSLDELDKVETDKGEYLYFRDNSPGQSLDSLLQPLVIECLNKLPIERRMRWGSRRSQFVRPVHWLVSLYGDTVIPIELFNLTAGRETRGHRFMAPDLISLSAADDYLESLRSAKVLADFDERRAVINEQLAAIAKKENCEVVIDPALLNEVTALVEWPCALLGNFDSGFLAVPEEALVSAMKAHQRYFHVLDARGKLLPRFVTVSNIESVDPEAVVRGNERVIAPRLSDAAFFFTQDQKTPLEKKLDRLEQVVFQKELGTYRQKANRVAQLAGLLADRAGADVDAARRAGLLCKADLVTDMVGEFADLQGIMGGYYARHDGEPETVAVAIQQHYRPIASGGLLPESTTAMCVAIADKLDTLVGLFGIGQPPSGSRDPFALRRQSLGIIRMCIDGNLSLSLKDMINLALGLHKDAVTEVQAADNIYRYFIERLSNWYQEQGIQFDSVNAVRDSKKPIDLLQDDNGRIRELDAFRSSETAEHLIGANKRIANILRKAKTDNLPAVDASLFESDAEVAMVAALDQLASDLAAEWNYAARLKLAAGIQATVDRYFDDVMIMSDNEALKNNRLAVLVKAQNLFLEIADFAVLQ